MSIETDATAFLSDPSNAVAPPTLIAARNPHLRAAGLYAWWVDQDGAALLSRGLGSVVRPGLIYIGQTGATSNNGRRSDSTLWKRLTRGHLGRNARKSTLRRLLGSVRATALGAAEVDEDALTRWMHEHLMVSTFPVENRDTLKKLETTVIHQLDPLLNVDEMPATPLRNEAARLRKKFYGVGSR